MVRYCILLFLVSFAATAQPQRRWKFQTQDKIYSSPLFNNNALYIGSGDGHMYALDAETGSLRWKFKTGGAVHSSPVADDAAVYFLSHDGNAYAVSIKDGSLRWKFSTKGERIYDMWDYYQSSPVIAGDKIIFGSGDGSVYAVDKREGTQQWEFATGDVVHAAPVLFNNKIYIGSFNGMLYALDAATGNQVWKFKTKGETYFPKGEVQREVVVNDGKVFFGSRDFNLYALDATTGKELWSLKEAGSWVVAAPIVDGADLLFGTSDSHAFCAVSIDGKPQWRTHVPMRIYGRAALFGDQVLTGCFDGKLIAIDRKSGSVRWSYQTDGSIANYQNVYGDDGNFKPGFELYGKDMEGSEKAILSLGSILSSPLVVNDVVYFGSADGAVYALELQ